MVKHSKKIVKWSIEWHTLVSQLVVLPDDGRGGLVPLSVGVPVDGHLLPEAHPLVVGQAVVHHHLVANVLEFLVGRGIYSVMQ